MSKKSNLGHYYRFSGLKKNISAANAKCIPGQAIIINDYI